MSYAKNIEIKIIRTKHEITFSNNTRVIDILEDLKKIPLEAKLVDFYTTDEDFQHVIVFEEEKQENPT